MLNVFQRNEGSFGLVEPQGSEYGQSERPFSFSRPLEAQTCSGLRPHDRSNRSVGEQTHNATDDGGSITFGCLAIKDQAALSKIASPRGDGIQFTFGQVALRRFVRPVPLPL